MYRITADIYYLRDEDKLKLLIFFLYNHSFLVVVFTRFIGIRSHVIRALRVHSPHTPMKNILSCVTGE